MKNDAAAYVKELDGSLTKLEGELDHLPPDLHQRLQPGVRAHGQTHLILQCLQAVKQCEQVVRHRAERILFVIQQRIDTGANGLRILRARPDNEKVVVQQPLR